MKPIPKAITFEFTGERRFAKPEEYFLHGDAELLYAVAQTKSEYPIYRMRHTNHDLEVVPVFNGYEYTGECRPPRKGEWYLGVYSKGLHQATENHAVNGGYCHIYRKLDEPEVIAFEKTGEIRPAKAGEFFQDPKGNIYNGYDHSETSYPILRKIDPIRVSVAPPPKAPTYAPTGEYRPPKKGEFFLVIEGVSRCEVEGPYSRHIYRRIEPS